MAMPHSNDTTFVKQQYATSANLDARIALHKQFSTSSENFHNWLFKHVELPDTARVLEIGCGSGALWESVHLKIPRGWKITLSDFSFGMATQARGNLEALISNLTFANCDAQWLPFAAETFDSIFANHMLYHVPDLERAFGEIRRVLKRGGTLYAATNGAAHLRELDMLVAELLHQPAPDAHRFIGAFGLENGGAQLEKYFANVTRAMHESNLLVTEVEPLVAYVKSGWMYKDAREISVEQEFRARVQGEIDQRGAFHITKSVGMFIAS